MQILGLFVNTLKAADKYYLLNRDNFFKDLQIQLSQKQQNIFAFFCAFWKSRINSQPPKDVIS